jgi:hypothetical protein
LTFILQKRSLNWQIAKINPEESCLCSTYVVLNRNFHSNVNVLGRFYKQFLTSLYIQIDIVWYIFETRNKNICKLNKGLHILITVSRFLEIITWHFPDRPWYYPETPISSPTAKLECWYGSRVDTRDHLWILQTVSNVIVQIDIVWYIFETRFETKIFASWTKATLLRIYFRNLSVHRFFCNIPFQVI